MDIEFLDAGCGDAIHIRYSGSDGYIHNILVDGGMEKGDIYERSLRKKLQEIITNKEKVDMWIISHIDDDHIGGILRLIKDKETITKLDWSKTIFWYNYSGWDYDTGIRENNLKSVKQAMRLRDFLQTTANVVSSITDALLPINLWGAKITILSPNEQAYNKLLQKWVNEEIKIRRKSVSKAKRSTANDYKTKIEDFDLDTEVLDHSEENASSICFMLEFNGKTILFTADSNPATLVAALHNLNGGKKVKLDYMQVPHHGSRYNISKRLLDLVDCEQYIISADGFNKFNLPNKSSMVKILAANPNHDVHFHITQENELTRNIFAVDTDHKINLNFPIKGSKGIHIKL